MSGVHMLAVGQGWPQFSRCSHGASGSGSALHVLPCVSIPTHQTWHWGSKRRIADYYAALAQKEQDEEAEYTASLKSKLQALEDELLA